MGLGSFDAAKYRSFTSTTKDKSTEEIYTKRKIAKDLNPLNVKVRESRDSTDNPNSTPIIVALDVTGSMGMLADVIAREGLGILFESILQRKPISNPHLMFMAIGDANYDKAPLQVSQFEADNRIVDQLTDIWLEHGGGGNQFESYNLAWYFAAFHTVHDSFEKRGKRGYLFTIGDESFPGRLTKEQIKKFVGDDLQGEPTSRDLLEMAARYYDIYHIVILEGNYCRMHDPLPSWREELGQRVIPLEDHRCLAETVVSAIEVAEGVAAEETSSKWGDDRGRVVHNAVRNLPPGRSGPKALGTS